MGNNFSCCARKRENDDCQPRAAHGKSKTVGKLMRNRVLGSKRSASVAVSSQLTNTETCEESKEVLTDDKPGLEVFVTTSAIVEDADEKDHMEEVTNMLLVSNDHQQDDIKNDVITSTAEFKHVVNNDHQQDESKTDVITSTAEFNDVVNKDDQQDKVINDVIRFIAEIDDAVSNDNQRKESKNEVITFTVKFDHVGEHEQSRKHLSEAKYEEENKDAQTSDVESLHDDSVVKHETEKIDSQKKTEKIIESEKNEKLDSDQYDSKGEKFDESMSKEDESKLASKPECSQSDESKVASKPECSQSDESKVAIKPECGQSDESKVAIKPECGQSDESKVAIKPECSQSDESKVAIKPECSQSDESKVAIKPECSQSDESKVAIKPECSQADESKVAIKPECSQADKSKVAIKPECSQSDESKVAIKPECSQSDESKVAIKPECSQSDESKVAIKPECSQTDESKVAIKPECSQADESKVAIKPECSQSDESKVAIKPECSQADVDDVSPSSPKQRSTLKRDGLKILTDKETSQPEVPTENHTMKKELNPLLPPAAIKPPKIKHRKSKEKQEEMQLAFLSLMKAFNMPQKNPLDDRLIKTESLPAIVATSTDEEKKENAQSDTEQVLCRNAVSLSSISTLEKIEAEISEAAGPSGGSQTSTSIPLVKKVSDFAVPPRKYMSPLKPNSFKKPAKHIFAVPSVAKADIVSKEDIKWTQVESTNPQAQMPWICRAPKFNVVFPPLGDRLYKRMGSIQSMQRRKIIPQIRSIEILKLECNRFPGIRVNTLRRGRDKYCFDLPKVKTEDEEEDKIDQT